MEAPKTAEQINMPLTGSAEVPAAPIVPAEQPRGITTMPSAIMMLPQDVALLVSKAVDMANGLVIETNEDYEASTCLLQTYLEVTADKTGQLDLLLNDNIKRWFEGHRAATKQKSDLKAPFLTARDSVEVKRREYREKVRKVDEEKTRQLQATAKAQQDSAALEQASRLEQVGEPEAAAAVVEMAARAPAPAVATQSSLPQAKGGGVVKHTWKFKIVNPDIIQREYLVPKNPMEPDSYPKIKSVVETLGKACGVLGIEVFEDESEYVRRAKKG